MTFALSKSEEEEEKEKDNEAKTKTKDVLHASLLTLFHRSVRSRNVLAFAENMQKPLSTTQPRFNLLNKYFEMSLLE